MSTVNWLSDAQLLLRDPSLQRSLARIARGGLAEVVTEALQCAADRQDQLLIKIGDDDEVYDWVGINMLANRLDFSVLI